MFSLYGYLSRYEKNYEGEPENWIERQIEVAENWMEAQMDGVEEESVEGSKIVDQKSMELTQKKRDSGLAWL